MVDELDFDYTRYVCNPVNGHVGEVKISIKSNSASFFENVSGQVILRCICSLQEMEDRLNMWNFRA